MASCVKMDDPAAFFDGMIGALGELDIEAKAAEDAYADLEEKKEAEAAAVDGGAAAAAAATMEAQAAFVAAAQKAETKKTQVKTMIETAAGEQGVDQAEVVQGTQQHIKKKEDERIFNLIKASQTVDICFVLDATGSMEHHIKAVRKYIRGIIGDIQGKVKHLQFRLSLVGYRDVCDGADQFVVLPFGGSISAFENALDNLKAKGGGDECEDLIGGLAKAKDLDWKLFGKLLILCADAPCHGREYHDGCGDDHPGGLGQASQPIIASLKEKRVDFTFLKIQNTTDKMINKFNEEAGGRYIFTTELPPWKDGETDKEKKENEKIFGEAIKRSISASLSRSMSKSCMLAKSAAEKRPFAPCSFRLKALIEEEEEAAEEEDDA